MTAFFWRAGAQVRRSCSRCGERWIAGQFACWRCRSVIFLEEPEALKIPEDTKPTEARGWQ